MYVVIPCEAQQQIEIVKSYFGICSHAVKHTHGNSLQNMIS